MTLDVFSWRYIFVAELNGSVLKFGVRYKIPENAKDLTPIAFTFWLNIVTNVQPQGGHLNDVSSFIVYFLWMFAS